MSYEDIIDLPHHVSEKRAKMPISKRAAQFASFKALSGFEEKISESQRLTQVRRELTDDEKDLLDRVVGQLMEHGHEQPEIIVTYFKADTRKSGGEYVTMRGNFRFLDMAEHMLRLTDGRSIPLNDVVQIEFTEE